MTVEQMGGEHGTVQWSGRLVVPDLTEWERALKAGFLQDGIDGWDVVVGETDKYLGMRDRNGFQRTVKLGPGELLLLPKPNLVVNTGINMRLDRLFAISGPPAAVAKMGVDAADVTNADPTATTSSSGTNKKTIIAFDSTATRASQVVTTVGTYTQANVNFIMKRLFLSNTSATLTNSATADDANSLHSMTNRFTIDLTSFATWSQTFSATVTGTGS